MRGKMNINLPEPTATVKASAKQNMANRKNALKSTGPKTPGGKLAVARNGIEHGIYALWPVIEEVESARDWKRYRQAMLTSLVLVGMLEVSLAERIILTSWRLRRTARYETEQIRLTQGSAMETVGASLGLEPERATSGLEENLVRCGMARADLAEHPTLC